MGYIIQFCTLYHIPKTKLLLNRKLNPHLQEDCLDTAQKMAHVTHSEVSNITNPEAGGISDLPRVDNLV